MRNIHETLEQIIDNLSLIKNSNADFSPIEKDILLQNLREAYLLILQMPSVINTQNIQNQKDIITPEKNDIAEEQELQKEEIVTKTEAPAEEKVREEILPDEENEEMDTDILEFIKVVPEKEVKKEFMHKPEPEINFGEEIDVKFEEPVKMEPEPKLKPETEPKIEIKPEVKLEEPIKMEPEPELKPEPEAKIEIKPEVKLEEPVKMELEPELKPEPEAKIEIKPEVKLEEPVKMELEPELEPEPEAKIEIKPEVKLEEPVQKETEPVVKPKSAQVIMFESTPATTSAIPSNPEPVKPQQRSLNDLFNEQKQDLGDKYQQAKITDLTKAMSINDKFLFIRELFKNKSEEFSRAIHTLNNCENIEEAFDIMEGLKKQYFWDSTSSAYLALCDLVRRKF